MASRSPTRTDHVESTTPFFSAEELRGFADVGRNDTSYDDTLERCFNAALDEVQEFDASVHEGRTVDYYRGLSTVMVLSERPADAPVGTYIDADGRSMSLTGYTVDDSGEDVRMVYTGTDAFPALSTTFANPVSFAYTSEEDDDTRSAMLALQLLVKANFMDARGMSGKELRRRALRFVRRSLVA